MWLGPHLFDFLRRDLVVAAHLHLLSQFSQILHQVVSKGIVVVEDEIPWRKSLEKQFSEDAAQCEESWRKATNSGKRPVNAGFVARIFPPRAHDSGHSWNVRLSSGECSSGCKETVMLICQWLKSSFLAWLERASNGAETAAPGGVAAYAACDAAALARSSEPCWKPITMEMAGRLARRIT